MTSRAAWRLSTGSWGGILNFNGWGFCLGEEA